MGSRSKIGLFGFLAATDLGLPRLAWGIMGGERRYSAPRRKCPASDAIAAGVSRRVPSSRGAPIRLWREVRKGFG